MKWIPMILLLLSSCSIMPDAGKIIIKKSTLEKSEDSIVAGRVRLLRRTSRRNPKYEPGMWEFVYKGPPFYMENTSNYEITHMYLWGRYSWEKFWEGSDDGYGKPVFRNDKPGLYILKYMEAPLLKFQLPKGKILYLGTVELYVTQESRGFGMECFIDKFRIVNEYEKTMKLFKKSYPDILKKYKNDIVILKSDKGYISNFKASYEQ